MLKSLESHSFWVLPAIAVLQYVYADLRLNAVLGGRGRQPTTPVQPDDNFMCRVGVYRVKDYRV